ncbi:hypothetical protein MUK42_22829 [Musa troglodytarum]|uniref:Glabrous enhancer-binding protein-like DBD domain-containing protein n=1 Tax=Musa troglodytarum TaxID=320322 RepID=A0A9E7GK61_9LILI|nr:hypothetical protein MUK42_22829 [Musa troglodytarum]
MLGDPSAAAAKGRRKRMAGEHPGDGEKGSNSGRKRSNESSAADYAAILRGAIEFRDQTGLAPTKSNLAPFYEFVKGSLPDILSPDQVFNRLRHIRHKYNHSAADAGDDLVLKLAAKLWPEEEVKKGNKEGKNPKKEKKHNSILLEEDINAENGKKEEKSPKTHNLVALEEDRKAEKGKKEEKSLNKLKILNSVTLQEDRDAEKGIEDEKSSKNRKIHNSVTLEENRYVEKWNKDEKSPRKEAKHNLMVVRVDRDAEKEDDKKGKKGTGTKLKKKQNLVAPEEEDEEMGNKIRDEEIENKNGEEWGIEPESFPYLTHHVAEHWKTNGLSKASLEVGMKLINKSKVRTLEDKWKRHLEDEMKFEMNWAKTCGELFAMLLEMHKALR